MAPTSENQEETLLITGYAKLPSTITAYRLYEVVAIAVEVNPRDGKIVDVDCTLATSVARKIVREIAWGYKLSDGIEELVQRIERRYWGSARKAIIMAFKVIYEKFVAYKQGRSFEQTEKK
ncbi:protein of unknown function [Thermanaeromonas toyohensis ToBE]|uniref:DUF3870 domain-containing protein n=1 Tax=Thermanaeromonas toyohensis ToBE TaxID=698762 RepID=A0A1W1VVR7_9FIRM|nr:DUF3870 domain-containing protein [Thermanaeromonas toyohensis]SMB97472.1 protein of unknown function [Thermanaeromonas toyohensis ToBE]